MKKINLVKRKQLKIKRKSMWKITIFKNQKTYYLVDFDEDVDVAKWGSEKNAMVFSSKERGKEFIAYFDLDSRDINIVKRPMWVKY